LGQKRIEQVAGAWSILHGLKRTDHLGDADVPDRLFGTVLRRLRDGPQGGDRVGRQRAIQGCVFQARQVAQAVESGFVIVFQVKKGIVPTQEIIQCLARQVGLSA
jgi:hypothetical protein